MRLGEVALAVEVLAVRSQHKHTLSVRINAALQKLASRFSWPFLSREMSFTTAPWKQSIHKWASTSGSQLVTVVGGASDIDELYTGASVMLVGTDSVSGLAVSFVSKIARIIGAASYGTSVITLVTACPYTIALATLTVARTDYVLNSGDGEWLFADKLVGRLLSDGSVKNPTIAAKSTQSRLSEISQKTLANPEDGPSEYVTGKASRIQAPRFAPVVVSSANNVATKPVVPGTYHAACAYYCKQSGNISDTGPVLTFEVSSNNEYTFRYGRGSGSGLGVPEESYTLLLFISRPNPAGLDGIELSKLDRLNSRMIRMFLASTKAFSGANFPVVNIDEDIPTRRPFYTSDTRTMVTLSAPPKYSRMYSADCKAQLPFYNDKDDHIPIPDRALDCLVAAVDHGIAISSSSPEQEVQSKAMSLEVAVSKLKMEVMADEINAIPDNRRFWDATLSTQTEWPR